MRLSRYGVDGHFALHPPRFYAPLLHVYNCLLLGLLSQPTTIVRPTPFPCHGCLGREGLWALNRYCLCASPFSIDWWIFLTLTGFSIGCVTSVKWIGLFVTSVVGLYTLQDLWDKFGDLRMPFVRISQTNCDQCFSSSCLIVCG